MTTWMHNRSAALTNYSMREWYFVVADEDEVCVVVQARRIDVLNDGFMRNVSS